VRELGYSLRNVVACGDAENDGGAHTPLPAVADVLTLMDHGAMSLVIHLSLAPL